MKTVEFVRVPGGKEEYVDTKYVQMLQDVLKVAHLYYSPHVDLTKRLQGRMIVSSFMGRQHVHGTDGGRSPLPHDDESVVHVQLPDNS